jgi:hypothetical protein
VVIAERVIVGHHDRAGERRYGWSEHFAGLHRHMRDRTKSYQLTSDYAMPGIQQQYVQGLAAANV